MEKHEVLKPIYDQIRNQAIKDFTLRCLQNIPLDDGNGQNFWTMPATTSGKYHPPEAREEGGLVFHVQRACYFANMLMNAYQIKADDIKGDIIISALLLHDISKKSKYKKYWDYVDHPVHAVKFIEKFQGNLPNNIFKVIKNCVKHHMGPWGGKFWKKPLKEYTFLELVVYNSDYLSARKDLKVE